MKVGILIPAYNESEHMGGLVRTLRGMGFDPIVIDDGSKDNTAEKAKEAGAKVIKHEKNLGKGEALKAGFAAAIKDDYDAAIIMDGDAQHSPNDIEKLIKTAEKNPGAMIIGNRMSNPRNMPFARKLTNRFMSLLVSGICRQRIPDSQCGFRLIRKNLLKNLKIDSSRFEVESEILIRASARGVKIISVPIETLYGRESSQINPFWDTCRFIYFLLKLALNKK
ncbi:MAG: glycosyltransferase family 2 protein [Candidatus Omnitrophica bacterium]|nr:glycosyltransferase family 2 protein [Candidatus Omnitrophota bacterium]MCG2705143.1 glycosyltransferase family 2 protein [Candidatus Omnitrophota bacterium]